MTPVTVPLDDPFSVFDDDRPVDATGETVVWQLAVARAQESHDALGAIQRIEGDVDVASRRLDAVLGDGGAAVSFTAAAGATASAWAPATPEAELDGWLRSAAGADSPAFAAADAQAAPEWWTDALSGVRGLVQGTLRACSPRAFVETRVDGRLVARSHLALHGDVVSVVQPAPGSGAGLALHREAVAAATAARATVLRVVSLALGGAAAIGTRIWTPAGPLLALPAAWRFVRRVLAARRTERTADGR